MASFICFRSLVRRLVCQFFKKGLKNKGEGSKWLKMMQWQAPGFLK